MDPRPLKIDFVSDVVCPWCAIGLASLQTALARLPELPHTLLFHPFELNPQMAPEGEDIVEHLQRKYGATPEQQAKNREAIRARGAEVGFTFGPQRTRTWNTFDAHRLLHWAAESAGPTAQRALKQALLEAYHGAGANVSDRAVLVACAAAAGLDAEQAQRVLDEGRYADAVRAAERQWQAAGIHAVPAVIVNDTYLIQGGQPPEVFEQALREIAVKAAEEGEAAA